MNGHIRRRSAVAVALAFLLGALASSNPVSAQTAGTATGSAFGVELGGPVPIDAMPVVEAQIPPGGSDSKSDALVEAPADPLATAFTAKVEADVATSLTVEADLASIIEAAQAGAPSTWHGRGYAVTEDLVAVTGQVTADVIEAEAVAGCDGTSEVFGSAASVAKVSVGGTAVPIPTPTPNQTLFDQGGIKIVLWETNWDPATGGTTDGSDTVFSNAMHVIGPGGVDLVVSHAQATVANCAVAQIVDPDPDPPPDDDVAPKNDEAPAATPVQAQPSFTG